MARVFRSLSRSSSSRTLGSYSEPSTSGSVKIKEIIHVENIEKHLNNWTIPKVSTSSVYNKGSFHLKSNYIIKIVEEVLLITSGVMEVPLITQNFVNTCKESMDTFISVLFKLP